MSPTSDSDLSEMSDLSGSSSSRGDHEDTCGLHRSSHEGLCFATTYAKRLCQNVANVTRPGCLPVCAKHRGNQQHLPAGKCQAIEGCGQICNRLAVQNPPYHLCLKHAKGTDTLPCPIMQLPTELRLMIFRYLIPKKVFHGRDVESGILYVSRQFHQESTSVLYGESCFQADLQLDGIGLLGQRWCRIPITTSRTRDPSIGNVLRQDGARLIQNLTLNLHIGFSVYAKFPRGIGTTGVTKEDYYIYAMRENARRFVQLVTLPSNTLVGLNNLKRLTLKITMRSTPVWSPKEATYALFVILEPFRTLRGIRHPALEIHPANGQTRRIQAYQYFDVLQAEWLKSLQKPSKKSKPSINTVADKLYEKIQGFHQFAYHNNSIGVGGRQWVSNTFHGIERPLHLARVAFEYGDISGLEKIRNAIKVRWINHQRQQIRSLQLVGNTINTLCVDSDADSDSESPQKEFPDVFDLDLYEPITQEHTVNDNWYELEWKDEAPTIGDPDVRVRQKGVFVIIGRHGQEWGRLATPALVRAIKAMKAASQMASSR